MDNSLSSYDDLVTCICIWIYQKHEGPINTGPYLCKFSLCFVVEENGSSSLQQRCSSRNVHMKPSRVIPIHHFPNRNACGMTRSSRTIPSSIMDAKCWNVISVACFSSRRTYSMIMSNVTHYSANIIAVSAATSIQQQTG